MSHTVHRPPSTVHRQLVAYFRSGWAFLIPYLAAYLLYAWLKWPVNPVAAGSSPVDGGQLAVSAIGALPSTGTSSTAHSLLPTGVPCLLHVYWFLHALHLVLGALALRAWWKGSGTTVTGATDDSENTANHSATPQPLVSPKSDVGGSTDSPSTVHRAAQPLLSTVPQSGHRLPSTVYRLLPWLLLALLFYIPGVYLEWPSDPWEHYSRVNEWRVLNTVTAHSTWMKSSYFIPYSLLSWCVGLRQIFWLDFYYTGICLLLCWQYYRLARACDLGERASMVFVLLQALLFGNNIFSFYRYYGISSSIYAQLGAVALTRIVLEAAKHPQLSLRSFFSVPHFISRLIVHRQPPALRSSAPSEVGSDLPPTVSRPPSSAPQPTVYRLLLTLIPILTLIAFNHTQGLGIAGLAVGAVIVWRLIEWRRSMIWWLGGGAIVLNIATVLWFPRHPMLDGIYRSQGWLTKWSGFNLLLPGSPPNLGIVKILGVVGIVNLGTSLLLLRRNHIIGWLTVFPFVALCLPLFALPMAGALMKDNVENIIVFHRFILGIPASLALVALATAEAAKPTRAGTKWSHQIRSTFLLTVVLTLLLFVTVPCGHPYYNRLWNALTLVAADQRMAHVTNAVADQTKWRPGAVDYKTAAFFSTDGASFIAYSTAIRTIVYNNRLIMHPAILPTATSIQRTMEALAWPQVSFLFIPECRSLITPASQAAQISGHWLPQETALAHAAGSELAAFAKHQGSSAMTFNGGIFYLFGTYRIPYDN